jgi:hypothetical protein
MMGLALSLSAVYAPLRRCFTQRSSNHLHSAPECRAKRVIFSGLAAPAKHLQRRHSTGLFAATSNGLAVLPLSRFAVQR